MAGKRFRILLIRTFIVLTGCFCCSVTYADEFSNISACPRPEPGSVIGSCAARKNKALIENSPYAPLRWMACLQRAQHLPCGCSADANFFANLASEWEKEIDANILSLNKLLSKRDRMALREEQKAWVAARERASKKRAKEKTPDGSLYRIFNTVAEVSSPEDRAIELACRVEKLTSK